MQRKAVQQCAESLRAFDSAHFAQASIESEKGHKAAKKYLEGLQKIIAPHVLEDPLRAIKKSLKLT
jgi:hypothetical protein